MMKKQKSGNYKVFSEQTGKCLGKFRSKKAARKKARMVMRE